MKYILFLIMISSLSVAAQDCKFKKNEVDEFTKQKVLETKQETLSKSGTFYSAITAKKINDQRILEVYFSSLSLFSLYEGKTLMLLTDKGDVIELKFPESKVSDRLYNSAAKTTTWFQTQYFPLNDDTYRKLLSSKINKVRVNSSDGYIDSEVKDKWWKKDQELLKCIE